MTRRLTVAQAIVAFLKAQYSSRDGREHQFIEGCFGIFGHGNVCGLGQALEQDPRLRYYLCRNEQAMVHTAAAYAKSTFRMRTIACTTSIGPGATNMITGPLPQRSIGCRCCCYLATFLRAATWPPCCSRWNRLLPRIFPSTIALSQSHAIGTAFSVPSNCLLRF